MAEPRQESLGTNEGASSRPQGLSDPSGVVAVPGLAQKRSDLPRAPPLGKRQRGSFAKAHATLRDPESRACARTALLHDFWSNSNRGVVAAKREAVEALAAEAAGCTREELYPLKKDIVLDTAAALKAAEFRSGPSYLTELRLGHVDAGYGVDEPLARLLKQCNLSLNRGIGPPQKAAELRDSEVRFEDHPLKSACQDVRSDDSDVAAAPLESWLVASGFLLREIETAALAVAHVELEAKSAALWLPASKEDAQGTGVRRTLACWCREADSIACRTCPVCILKAYVPWRKSTLDDTPESLWNAPLFPSLSGRTLSKKAMVAGWQRLAPSDHPPLGGHSARRSGAKRLARWGWPTASIQFLGRWASLVVLEYIEEAAAEVPLEASGQTLAQKNDLETSAPLALRYKDLEVFAARLRAVDARLAVLDSALAALKEDDRKVSEQSSLPQLVISLAHKRAHVAATLSFATPAKFWRTRCGWAFANSSDFTLANAIPSEIATCDRCIKKRASATEWW